MDKHPIALAYRAARFVPTESFRTHRDRYKKMYNPVKTAPALVQAMTHLGETRLPLGEAKRRAHEAIQEPEAQAFINDISSWTQLRDFLDTLALFLKAEVQVWQGRKKRRQTMRAFQRQGEEHWDTKKVVPKAKELSEQIARERDININKLKKLESCIKGCRNEWEALARLAQYYPLSGTPARVIDEWVTLLGQVDLDTFKQLVSYTVVFCRADDIE